MSCRDNSIRRESHKREEESPFALATGAVVVQIGSILKKGYRVSQ